MPKRIHPSVSELRSRAGSPEEAARLQVADFARRYRKEHRVTRSRAAEQAGVSEETWGRMERGLTTKLDGNFLRVATGLGISVEELARATQVKARGDGEATPVLPEAIPAASAGITPAGQTTGLSGKLAVDEELASLETLRRDAEALSRAADELRRRLTSRARDVDIQDALNLRDLVLTFIHRRLPSDENTLLHRLLIFAGTWTQQAAEVVCSDQTFKGSQVARSIKELEQLGVLMVTEGASPGQRMTVRETRYRLHDIIRRCVQEQGDQALSMNKKTLAENHKKFFTGLAEELGPVIQSSDQRVWLEHLNKTLELTEGTFPGLQGPDRESLLTRLEEERENLHAVLDRCLASEHDVVSGLRLAGALWLFWDARGYSREGREYLEAFLEHPEAQHENEWRARALNGAGALAGRRGDYETARHYFDEGCRIWEGLQNQEKLSITLNNLGMAHMELGDSISARFCFSRAAEIDRTLFEETGENKYRFGEALSRNNLGSAMADAGEPTTACNAHEQSRKICEELGDALGIAYALGGLGRAWFDQGEYEKAASCLRQSLHEFAKNDIKLAMAECLESLASVLYAMHGDETGALLLGAATRLRGDVGAELPPSERRRYEQNRQSIVNGIGREDYQAAWEKGRAMPFQEIVNLAFRDVQGKPRLRVG